MKTFFLKNYSLPVCSYRGNIKDIQYPCYVSLKLDGELQYIIKKNDKIFSVNKSKYGRWRMNYKALLEFEELNLPNGIYLAELYWGDGRSKEEFYALLRNKTSDELKLAIWGILQYENYLTLSTTRTYEILEEIKNQCQNKNFKYLSVIPFWKVDDEEQLKNLIKEYILEKDYEGLVVRRLDAIYRDGQTIGFIKIKKKVREVASKNKNGEKINFKFNYGVWL